MPSIRFPSGLLITPELTSGMVVSMEIDFEPSVGIMARKIEKFGADIRSFRVPLTRAVREVMIPSIQMNFMKSGRPRWADLSEATWKQKSGKILVESGKLQQGMKSFGLWHIDTEKALIPSLPQSIWYGNLHQAGYGSAEMFHDPVTNETVNVGGSGAPARPFVVIQEEDGVKIDEIFNLWVGERIARAGLR
jgi:phage gpG-like protein